MYFQISDTFVFNIYKCINLTSFGAYAFETCVRTGIPLKCRNKTRVGGLGGCTFTFIPVLRISLLQKRLFFSEYLDM